MSEIKTNVKETGGKEKERVMCHVTYDRGDTLGVRAGESVVLDSLFATMLKGARVADADVVVGGAWLADAVALPFGTLFSTVLEPGGVVSLSSSGMVGQYVLRTCLRAGRRMGLERKKSMPESRHSYEVG